MDVTTASVDDLARWIESERPNVNAVVQASGGEPDLAQKLLEAESQATDGDPSQGRRGRPGGGDREGLTADVERGAGC
jgi:hypothetical protein